MRNLSHWYFIFCLIQCNHSVRKHIFFAQENLFPVADILKEGRIGVKGDTGEEIIARLKTVDFPNKRCSEKDLFYLIWTSGTWLMKNCERHAFISYIKNIYSYGILNIIL